MILVDTSVWIRFLANRAPYASELARLLGLGEVTGHDLVYGELLIGDRRGRKRLLADYERLHQAGNPADQNRHGEKHPHQNGGQAGIAADAIRQCIAKDNQSQASCNQSQT